MGGGGSVGGSFAGGNVKREAGGSRRWKDGPDMGKEVKWSCAGVREGGRGLFVKIGC